MSGVLVAKEEATFVAPTKLGLGTIAGHSLRTGLNQVSGVPGPGPMSRPMAVVAGQECSGDTVLLPVVV